MKHEFEVIFKDGTMSMFGRESEYIQLLKKLDGKEGRVIVENYGSKKSNQQNRYFRGVLLPHALKAFREAGHNLTNTDEALDVIKHYFFRYMKRLSGENMICYLSTCNSEWSTDEWENKMSEIRNWFQDKLNYTIPLPNEVL